MNLYMHIVTVAAAALMTSSMLFLLITLDRPFQGEFIIEPASLRTLLELIKHLTRQRQHYPQRQRDFLSGISICSACTSLRSLASATNSYNF